MGRIADIIKIVNNKFNLIFMSYCSCKCLNLKSLYLMGFTITYALNDSIKVFLVLRMNFSLHSKGFIIVTIIIPFLRFIFIIFLFLWKLWIYFGFNFEFSIVYFRCLIIVLILIIFFLNKSYVSHLLYRLIVYHYLVRTVLKFFCFFKCIVCGFLQIGAVLCFIHSKL